MIEMIVLSFETSLGELDDRGVSQRRFLLTSLARHGRR